jgi:hypothetical protein
VATEIAAIGPEHGAALRRFSERTWQRPRSEAFYRWRYDSCPALAGYLALRDGECVATATAFERPHRIGGETVVVRESFDWYCLPEYRRSGLGVRLMQRLMADPAPVTVIGGTPDTRDLLPRLGFEIPGEVTTFVLPLGARRAAEALHRRARVPRIATRAAFRVVGPLLLAPKLRAVPADGRMLPVASAGPELDALYAEARDYGSYPLWRRDQLHWMAQGFPGLGHYPLLYFARGDALVGFALLRIHETPESGRVARLLDVFAPRPDVELLTWMVSEAACLAAGYRPDYVAAYATHPALAAALARNRFRSGDRAPIHYWSRDRKLAGPLWFCGSWGDGPLLPYPARWWGEPEPAPSAGS